jgi:hypothetical protein
MLVSVSPRRTRWMRSSGIGSTCATTTGSLPLAWSGNLSTWPTRIVLRLPRLLSSESHRSKPWRCAIFDGATAADLVVAVAVLLGEALFGRNRRQHQIEGLRHALLRHAQLVSPRHVFGAAPHGDAAPDCARAALEIDAERALQARHPVVVVEPRPRARARSVASGPKNGRDRGRSRGGQELGVEFRDANPSCGSGSAGRSSRVAGTERSHRPRHPGQAMVVAVIASGQESICR